MEWDRNTSVEEIVRRYAAGEREMCDLEAENLDFDNVQLPGVRFVECCFHSSSMRRANLRGAAFVRCNAKCIDFARSDLRGAQFIDCAVCGSTFKDALVHGIDLTGSSYYGLDLKPELGFPLEADHATP